MIVRRPEDLAAAVRRARRDHGLSQTDLAHKVEVDRQWVYRLESGEPGVSLGLVLRALNVLGLKLDIGGEEKAPSAKPVPAAAKSTQSVSPRISIDEIVDE